MLPHVAQTAIDLAFDGLMIESHIRPENALTDREQQLTPSDLEELIRRLSLPVGLPGEEDAMLGELRKEIDEIDDSVLKMLARRMEIASRIGKHKRGQGMDVLQLERWTQVVEDRLEKGTAQGLSRNFLLKLLHAIHEEALRTQAGKKD
jgi:chorismate mutase